ncbi:MAG TPA: FecR domain-containing protein [Vicinamibacterales bacterium]
MVVPRACGGFLIVMLLLSAPVAAQQPVPAGHVKIATGAAYIVRQNAALPAKPGDAVFATDTLRTQANGTIGVTLADDTRISLGPDSEMRLERYVFAPADGALGMVLNFVRGVAAYVSGRMAKLAPDSVRLETPAAIVGVRGTTVAIKVGS